MATPVRKSLDAPDDRVELPGIAADVVEMGDTTISRSVFQPGIHCSQISYEGKPICMAHHSGFIVEGNLHVAMADGSMIDIRPGDVFDVPAGHDGWATGDVPLVLISWAGFHSWAPERLGERVLLTLLVTDIVGSTERAVTLGDRAWRELLARHYQANRAILDRFRGREVATTGDGMLATFDGPGRAIEAALAIRARAKADGISVRAGVHSGEVEVVSDDLRGVAVHEVTRIAASANADEILVSETTRMLAGADSFSFLERGRHDLKGLDGPRLLHAVEPPASRTAAG